MDDLAPSPIPPAAKWEKTPSNAGRQGCKHRPPREKPRDEESEALADAERHDLDELA
jgi:hypothetical protein